MSRPTSLPPRDASRYRFAVLLVALVLLLLAPFFLDVRGTLLATIETLRGFGPIALVYLAGMYIAACILMAPGSVLTLAAGFLAASLWPDEPLKAMAAGYLTVSFASVTGATLAFLLGRSLARGFIARRLEGNARFAAIDHAIGEGGFRIVFLLRLSPAFPFNLLNYGLGLTKVGLRDYVLASAIGMAPGTLLYVYLGETAQSITSAAAGNNQLGWARTTMLVVGLVATFAVVAYVTRVARQAMQVNGGG